MSKKSGPKAPDPVAVSQAQSAANIATAQEQQRLNMVGSQGPGGTVTWEADPNSPGGYKQVTTLSPDQQAIYSGSMGIAQDQLGRIQQALGQQMDLSSLPAFYTPDFQTQIARGKDFQYTFDPSRPIQEQVGGDLNAARMQAQNAAYQMATSRLDPRFAREEAQLQARLANQGLSMNSDAYGSAMDQFGRTKNDAYMGAQSNAVLQGNAAADQLFGQQLAQGQFANQAQAQDYGQKLGRAQFWNETSGTEFDQNTTEAQIRNAAEAQAAQIAMQQRDMAFDEQMALANQPINQFSALLSAGQIGTPEGFGYSPSQVNPTDVLGAYALQSQVQQANANRKASVFGGALGGLMGLGQAAIMGSDRRLKQNIRRVGTHPLGVGVYDFNYRGDSKTVRGVMADELKAVRPDLVIRRTDGYLAVNYAGL